MDDSSETEEILRLERSGPSTWDIAQILKLTEKDSDILFLNATHRQRDRFFHWLREENVDTKARKFTFEDGPIYGLDPVDQYVFIFWSHYNVHKSFYNLVHALKPTDGKYKVYGITILGTYIITDLIKEKIVATIDRRNTGMLFLTSGGRFRDILDLTKQDYEGLLTNIEYSAELKILP